MVLERYLVATVLVLLAWETRTVSSCSCYPLPTANDYFCSSSFVAIVTVTGDSANCGFFSKCYPFKMIRPLKIELSKLAPNVTLNANSLKTNVDEGICGVSFTPNDDYLVTGDINAMGEISVYLCHLVENWTHMDTATRDTFLKLFEPRLFCGEREDV